MTAIHKLLAVWALTLASVACPAATSTWKNDLSPISPGDWNDQYAAHLLERAGFGGSPSEIARLTAMQPNVAVSYLVNYHKIPNRLPAFDASGIYEPGFDKFPSSRPAATDLAHKTGQALGEIGRAHV